MKKLIIFSVIVFMLSASSAFSQVKVYDANDDFLGYFIQWEDMERIIIYVPSLGRFIEFQYSKSMPDGNGIIGGSMPPPSIYFGNNDCTGTPYVDQYSLYEMKDNYSIIHNCSKFYKLPDVSGETTYLPHGSYKDSTACSCTESYDWAHGIPLVEVTLPFDHPIALPLRFESEVGGKTVVIPLLGN